MEGIVPVSPLSASTFRSLVAPLIPPTNIIPAAAQHLSPSPSLLSMIASASASSWRKRHPRRFCFGVASLALVLAVILSTALGLVLSRRNANGKSTNTAAQPFNRNTTASSTEFELIKERRRKSFALAVETDDLVAATASSTFVATLTTAGQWPDVDYTSGCDARGWLLSS